MVDSHVHIGQFENIYYPAETCAMGNFPYTGIKLHPRAHCWDLTDAKITALVHELFAYADTHTLPVLIHTGDDKIESPHKFSNFFGTYPNVRFVLAHGRPVNETIPLLRHFANVYCDTAFMPETAVRKIVADGLGKKILPGSDFPITAYKSEAPLEIETQYVKDALQLRIHEKMIKDGIQ